MPWVPEWALASLTYSLVISRNKYLNNMHGGTFPDLFRRFIDDCVGTASCSCEALEQFIKFVDEFHPALKFTWKISETCVSFLDIPVSIMAILFVRQFPTSPLTLTAIYYFRLLIPNTVRNLSPNLNFSAFAVCAVKTKILSPDHWK